MESIGLHSVAVAKWRTSTSSFPTRNSKMCDSHGGIARGQRLPPSVYVKIVNHSPGHCFTFPCSSTSSNLCLSSIGGSRFTGGHLRLRGSRFRVKLKRWRDDPLSCDRARRFIFCPGASILCMALRSRNLGHSPSLHKCTANCVRQPSRVEFEHLWNSSALVAPMLAIVFSQNIHECGTFRKTKTPWINHSFAFRRDLPVYDKIQSRGNVALSLPKPSSFEDEQFSGQTGKSPPAPVTGSLRDSSKRSLGSSNASQFKATDKAKVLPLETDDPVSSISGSPFKQFFQKQAADYPGVGSEQKQVTSNGKRVTTGEAIRNHKVDSRAPPRSAAQGGRDDDSLGTSPGISRRLSRSSRNQGETPYSNAASTGDKSIHRSPSPPTGVRSPSRLSNSSVTEGRQQISLGSRQSSPGSSALLSTLGKVKPRAVLSEQMSQTVSEAGRNPRTSAGGNQTSSSSESLDRFHRFLEEQARTNGSRANMQGPMQPEDLARLWDRLKEQKQKSIEQIHRRLSLTRQVENDGQEFSLAVEPENLILGECVVHKRVGVGKYIGTKNEVPPGKTNPVTYIYLKYADGIAKLRAKQAHRLLYRYHLPGEVGRAPTLSKLKDPSLWEKRKQKGKVAIQKMVVNMMDLHVHRLKQSRPCYPSNQVHMAEFASRFPYTPTPDQLQAFADVARDMTELDLPMDRLICGDVGFGKTEVALRAILIAVLAGKQVMVLTPSTVLAKQQFETIRDRFSGFPGMKVALLCRFQKEAARKEAIVGIRDGSLDIVVGTHSLLGKQIRYNNLGLLVIDEEQRFGVKQKVKITCLKTSVDVLTLTATPIPRTLYMAMSGFRDTSLLATPPPERRPIKTHLSEYQQDIARNAILFELNRGGQVFYVVPRIKGIDKLQSSLKFQFPDVKIAVAHGKQAATVLEDAMERFCIGETKILLCTNIIESGLDIHRVNTIIIEDVQHFGLAQLYQLRGRVGRADQEAHAYLFHPNKAALSEEALERLNALRDCCELGQGFQLAERDMAIRGFGSLFGEEQSGDAAKIGTDLYFEMLLDGLSKVDNQRVSSVEYDDVHCELGVDTHIPADYISNPGDREATMKIAVLAARESLQALMISTNRLRERYGREPPSVEMLLKTLYIRRMAADLGINCIRPEGSAIRLETNMTKDAFEMISHSITSDSIRSFLVYEKGCIKIDGHLGVSNERQVERIFCCLADMCNGLPSFMKYL